MSKTQISTISDPVSTPNLLTLPPEIRHQIYSFVFSNLSLHAFPPNLYQIRGCDHCHHYPSLTLYFKSHFVPLLTCRQIYTEASPIFYDGLTIQVYDTFALDAIRKFSPYLLRKRILHLNVTVHLNDETKFAWHNALSLLPQIFPNLKRLKVNNHMRPPTSYDRLTDAIYLASPLVLSTLPTHLRSPPGLELKFAYLRDEVMFEALFLGEITTADSIEAHEAVVRDLLADELFRAAANRNPSSNEALNQWEEDGGRIPEFESYNEFTIRAGITNPPPSAFRGDFEEMTSRLLAVARAHEEQWLEGLQRRRLGGLTVREVQERIVRDAPPTDASGQGSANDSGSEEIDEVAAEEQVRREVERIVAENEWTAEHSAL